MNPPRWFRRTRPTPEPDPTTSEDKRIAAAWGLNPVQWHALTDHERRECRRTVTAAPNFGGTK